MSYSTALIDLLKTTATVLRPPPKLSLSEWSDKHAYLPETSPKPGPFSCAEMEFQRGILDAISDPRTRQVAIMSSAQVGKSQSLLNAIGYFIDQDPSTILLLMPTVDDAKDFSKERITAFVDATPRLRGKIAPQRSRDGSNTIMQKEFAGGNITLAGANAPGRLSSRPKRIVFCDEVDRYSSSAGKEGDPVALATVRTKNFWNRKIVLTSTPALKGTSRIEQAFEEGDCRRYWVACPKCGHLQVLRWAQVKWDKGPNGEHLPHTAGYECEWSDPDTGEVCDHRWSDAERWEAIRRAPEQGGGWRAEKPFFGIASFHLWEAYSSFVELGDTVREFLARKDNAEQLKVWTNTALGESWAERGEAPEWQRLYDRREKEMSVGTPPEWAGVLVGSADVQRGGGGRFDMDVWAFGPDRRRAFVERIEVFGPIADEGTWKELDREIARTWVSADGREMKLARVAIDTGDGENTMEVYRWARRHPGFVMAVKGRESIATQQAIGSPTWQDVTVGGRKIKRGVRLWNIGTSMLKMELFGQLNLERPVDGGEYPAGYVYLPDGMSDELVKQLVSEELRLVRRRSGGVRREWHKIRDRNEALDNAVYARAVAVSLGVDRWTSTHWAKVRGENVKPVAEVEQAPVEIVAAAAVAARGPRQRRPNPYTSRGR